MDREKLSELKKHFSYLKRQRSHWEKGIWQDVANFVVPLREDVQTAGSMQGTKAYDGTAIYAVNLAADGLHGYLVNPSIPWFILRLPRHLKFLEDIPNVRLWLEDVQSVLYSAFQYSNFYSEMRTYLRDGLSIGTAYLHVEDDIVENKMVFHCLHPKEGYIADNKYGEVDTLFRKVKLTAKQALESFGDENLSQAVKNSLKNNPYEYFDFVHAVFPRTDYDDRKISSTNKRFASVWFEENGEKALKENGYNIFPYMVWRYFKNANEVYGRSPAMLALPEIKGLNVISKDMLGASQLSVRPPYNIPAELKDKVQLTPMGMNYYGADYNRRIYPVNTGIQYPIGVDREDKKRDIVERYFHVDFFLMLQRAQREMTAREVIERMGEKASVLSASIGNLTVALDKIIDYVFYLETQAGRIPPPPEELMQYGGNNIDIVYTGVLAQAQKRLFETQGIRAGIESAMPLFQIYPETMDLVNADETVKELLISNGFPQTALNTPDAVTSIRQQRQQAQALASQKADAQMMTDMMQKMAQADKSTGGKLSKIVEEEMAVAE